MLLLVPHRTREVAGSLAPAARLCAVSRPETPAELAAIVSSHDADVLVVDTFPEGLLDELGSVRMPRLALLRVRRDADSERFHRGLDACHEAVDLEPELDWLHHARVTPLTAVARDIASPDEGDGSVCIIADRDAALGRLLDRVAHRVAATGARVRRVVPSSSAMRFGAPHGRPSIVVGAAGYNLTYELARARIHHLAIPRPRPFDDQRRRARLIAETVADPAALERRILELLLKPQPRPARSVAGHDAVADWVLANVS